MDQLLSRCVVQRLVAAPALGLQINVLERLSKRLEFDEAVNRKCERTALFQNYSGGGDKSVERTGWAHAQGNASKNNNKITVQQTPCVIPIPVIPFSSEHVPRAIDSHSGSLDKITYARYKRQ